MPGTPRTPVPPASFGLMTGAKASDTGFQTGAFLGRDPSLLQMSLGNQMNLPSFADKEPAG